VAICQDEEVITVAMLIPNEINTPSNFTALLQAYHVNGSQPTADLVTENMIRFKVRFSVIRI
jgi:hypothetical protein